ncbi:hypothetical protein ASPTUDRAFT_51234 [Aspergillus tubingensis CBS 134.48]|uniref:Secreted protein n=1 Tax=Aspergillus tubingensis (strain CBS 134.48) TaxID=767770 RepID=A0A1L9NGB8_ASPTC|nr:hypothetical protein ASPTUDRAFT_51234 [Aspergillus tubingensis CBS 134.48]
MHCQLIKEFLALSLSLSVLSLFAPSCCPLFLRSGRKFRAFGRGEKLKEKGKPVSGLVRFLIRFSAVSLACWGSDRVCFRVSSTPYYLSTYHYYYLSSTLTDGGNV